MIVGEAPGASEDRTGVAFVGASGRVLEKAIRELAQLDPTEVYISNAVKCRPPDNRTPSRTEVKACSSYLLGEISEVQPDYILTLGNTALQAVLRKSGIMKHHGSFERRHGALVMPTLHPAAVLRNPKWARVFATDVHRFGRRIRGEETSLDTKIKYIRTKQGLRALRALLMVAKEIAWDVETYTSPHPSDPKRKIYKRKGLHDWHGEDSKIVSISFTVTEGTSYVLLLDHQSPDWSDPYKVLSYLRPALEREDCVYVGHNVKFDARYLFRKTGIRVPHVHDTMLEAHMIDENQPKGLKPQSQVELGADAYDADVDVKEAFTENRKKLLVYNGKDTDYTLRLHHRLWKELNTDLRSKRIYEQLMMPASRVFMDVEHHGVWVDWQRWEQRYDEATDKRDRVHEYITRNWVPDELRPLNINSPKQVGHLLFDHLGLPIIERTKTKAPSTAESVLLRLAPDYKIALAIMKWRKWAKFLNTYLIPWQFVWRDDEGRIHSSYKLHGTVTGRLSGEGGIQQVPRDPFIRSIIGAPPGYAFVQADYSQVELRIAAMISGDRNMLGQYLRGEDIHTIRAQRMTGRLDVTKEERKKAKAVNFGYIYGMGAAKFVTYAFENYDVHISFEEAEADRNRFFDDYPALLPWHERQRRLARRYKRVASPLGRIRHLPDIESEDDKVQGESERQAINSPVQSMASDLMLFSAIRLHDLIPPEEGHIVGSVHDSLLFEIREDLVDKWCPIIKATMEDIKAVEKTFGCDITVPIIADIEVGTHWAEGQPWHPR